MLEKLTLFICLLLSVAHYAQPLGRSACTCTGTDWVHGEGNIVPLNAVKGGNNTEDPIYVGRGFYLGELIPGKMVQREGVLHVPYNGKVVRLTEFQILINISSVTWTTPSVYTIPARAIHGGLSAQFQEYYICRAVHEGFYVPGKLDYAQWTCLIPGNTTEVRYTNFQIPISAS